MLRYTIVALTLASCGTYENDAIDAAPPPTYSPRQAKLEFWQAFHAGDAAGIAAAREHLLAAMDVDAYDDEVPRIIGMSYGFTGLEGGGGGVAQDYIDKQGAYLKIAYERASTAPVVDRYAMALDMTLYAGYPIFQGQRTQDSALEQSGFELLDQGIAIEPGYNFGAAVILMRSAKGTQNFARGLDYYFKYLEMCVGGAIDRGSPDFTRMLRGGVANRLCQNVPHVPHLLSGTLFLLADVLVKNNQPDAARVVYEQVKATEGFASWRYRDQVDVRLSSDLVARAAQYDNPDASQHPMLGASPCTMCHQQ